MDDIVEKDRTNLTPKNVEAIGFIKYDLRARGLRAIQMVPSDQMIQNVISAHASYTVHLEREAHLAKKKTGHCLPECCPKKEVEDCISFQPTKKQQLPHPATELSTQTAKRPTETTQPANIVTGQIDILTNTPEKSAPRMSGRPMQTSITGFLKK